MIASHYCHSEQRKLSLVESPLHTKLLRARTAGACPERSRGMAIPNPKSMRRLFLAPRKSVQDLALLKDFNE